VPAETKVKRLLACLGTMAALVKLPQLPGLGSWKVIYAEDFGLDVFAAGMAARGGFFGRNHLLS
jgi:hypothetical protein